MINLKFAKKVPARATVRGVLVTKDHIADCGFDKRQLERLGFTGEVAAVEAVPGDDKSVVVLVGLGPSSEVSTDGLRKAGAAFAKAVSHHKSAVLDAGPGLAGLDDGAAGMRVLAEGVVAGSYRFLAHKDDPDHKLESVSIVGTGDPDEAAALAAGLAVGTAILFARDLVNEPGGVVTPTEFADRALRYAGEVGVDCEVLDRTGIEELRLGGLLAVNQGSAEEPRLVKLSYTPDDPEASLAFVGKGITFDSGGLSLKPPDGMMTMKCDMGGAAAVTAATCAIAALGLPVAITTITPLTDNMTGERAQRPGDVFTARNGKTVEVLNTDAEGRLVLADALTLASEGKPDAIVDMATLTGACMIALGMKIAGVMGNDEDWIDEIGDAAGVAGERVWPLPLPEDYRKQLDSDVADLKNIGQRYGGTLTAGLFLREFVDAEIPWAHIDIAGPAFADEPGIDHPKGATGFGVRTLVALAEGRVATEPDGEGEDD